MFALGYVLVPATFASLQAELDRSLRPFRRGGARDFPAKALAFDDVTEDLRRLHGTSFRLERQPGGGLVASSDGDLGTFVLDLGPAGEFMRHRGLGTWTGR